MNFIVLIVSVTSTTLALSATTNWVGVPIFDYDNSTLLPMNGVSGSLADTADFDQDGFDDVMVWDGNNVQVLLNQSGKGFTQVFSAPINGSWRAADVNGDGFPDLINPVINQGMTVLINQLGPNYACATDLDKDGQTAVGDLLFLIEEWGPCS